MAHADVRDPTTGTGGGLLGTVDRALHRIEKATSLIAGYGIFALMMLGDRIGRSTEPRLKLH